jgi:hypothetical protein
MLAVYDGAHSLLIGSAHRDFPFTPPPLKLLIGTVLFYLIKEREKKMKL